MERPEIKEYSGDDLLSQGVTIDAWKQPIVPGTSYEVKLFHKQKRMTILSKSDWQIQKHYETGQTIFQQGLFSWADYGLRLGFFIEYEDCIPGVEAIIETYNKREDYEKSAHLTKQLEKFRKRILEEQK
jgi:hypothetical protein